MAISQRAKKLFGEDGARTVAFQLESEPKIDPQLLLFQEARQEVPEIKGRGGKRGRSMARADELTTDLEATTLDLVHAAMLLQAGGMTNALRALIKAEQQWEVRKGRFVYQARIRMDTPEKLYLVRVFVDTDCEPPEIVTAYRTSKIEKYWRD